MIRPIGFYSVSSGRKYSSSYTSGKPKKIKPLKESDRQAHIAPNTALYKEIQDIDKRIAKLEGQLQRAEKTNSNFDRMATLQEIGKLLNHRIVLNIQLNEEIEKALNNNELK
jgi:uncharacterized protein involved in exopolysaccharide biosynthesis